MNFSALHVLSQRPTPIKTTDWFLKIFITFVLCDSHSPEFLPYPGVRDFSSAVSGFCQVCLYSDPPYHARKTSGTQGISPTHDSRNGCSACYSLQGCSYILVYFSCGQVLQLWRTKPAARERASEGH